MSVCTGVGLEHDASDQVHIAPAPEPGPLRDRGEVPGQARDGCVPDGAQRALNSAGC